MQKFITLLPPGKRRRWVGLVGLAMLVSAMEVAAALLIFLLLNLVTEPKRALVLPVVGDLRVRFSGVPESQLVLGVTAFIGLFFVVRAITYVAQSYLQNRVSSSAGALLARRLLRGYLAMPYTAHLRRNSAELIRNAHESVTLLAQQVFVPAISLASESMLTLAIFATLLRARPAMTLAVLAVLGPVVLVILKVIQPRMLAHGQVANDMSEESLRSLSQSFDGLRDITVLGKHAYFEEEFGRIRSRFARALYLRAVLADVPRIVLETSLVIFILAYVGVTIGAKASAEGAVASLGLFAYAALRVLPSLNRITNNLQSLKFSRPIIDALYEDVLVADAAVARGQLSSTGDALAFRDAITLRDVSFCYDGTDTDALTDVNLEIVRGEFVGFIGATGGGKSTLIDLVIGLLEPTSGEVLVDGVDIHSNLTGWNSRIGMVPQTVFLLDDTLRRNIALGLPDDEIDEANVASAVNVAQLADLVATLPAGLDTRVGERGVRLSGGQRQRVAIARALYRRPDVLIFDEGTSALDDATEAALVHALEQLRDDRTLIAVAHRLSTVQNCDRVVVVEDGRIVEVGAFRDVLRHHPQFGSRATEASDR